MELTLLNKTWYPFSLKKRFSKKSQDTPTNCPRYLLRPNGGEGLGHRHTALAILIDLALEFHFEILLHDSITQGGAHGEYPLAQDMMGLSKIKRLSEINQDHMQFISTGSVEDFYQLYLSKLKDQCNLIVSVETGAGNSCINKNGERDWCFSFLPGFLDKAYRFFLYPRLTDSLKFSHSILDYATKKRELLVAWHVRCGDWVVYHHDNFYSNIYQLLHENGLPYTHLYFGNCDHATYERLRNLIPGLQYIPIQDKQEVHSFMKKADILVHGGSTFTVSAHLSTTHRQLFLQTSHKEGEKAKSSYAFHAAINIDDNGKVEPDQFVDVHEIIRSLYCLKFENCTEQGSVWNQFISLKIIASYIPMQANGSEITLTWLKNAKLVERFLPGWMIVLYYNISTADPSICHLRGQSNILMIDASQFKIPQEKWAHSMDAVIWETPWQVFNTCDLQAII